MHLRGQKRHKEQRPAQFVDASAVLDPFLGQRSKALGRVPHALATSGNLAQQGQDTFRFRMSAVARSLLLCVSLGRSKGAGRQTAGSVFLDPGLNQAADDEVGDQDVILKVAHCGGASRVSFCKPLLNRPPVVGDARAHRHRIAHHFQRNWTQKQRRHTWLALPQTHSLGPSDPPTPTLPINGLQTQSHGLSIAPSITGKVLGERSPNATVDGSKSDPA